MKDTVQFQKDDNCTLYIVIYKDDIYYDDLIDVDLAEFDQMSCKEIKKTVNLLVKVRTQVKNT